MKSPTGVDLGPPGFNRYNKYKTTLEEKRARNPDRWGAVSGTMVILLLATILASSFVFGFNWNRLSNKERLTQNDIDALWQTYNGLVADIGDIVLTCDCEGVNITFPVEFSDAEFAIFDETDPSRIIVFDLEHLSADATSPQTVLVQNANGTVAYIDDIPVFPNTFTDDEFAVFSKNDASTRIAFDVSGVVSNAPVTLHFQNADGIVALLDDIEDPTDETTFPQNQFEVVHAQDTQKRFRFDVDTLVSEDSTRILTVPNDSGIVAYLSDFVRSEVFPEDVFVVFSAGNVTKRVLFDASDAVSGVPSVMTLQDRSGTIAYENQLIEFVDSDITEDRLFPHPDYEGGSTFEELGIVQVSITMCGGGGNGRMDRNVDLEDVGGGGGGGSGFRDLVITNPSDLYTHFIISIGEGGEGSASTPCVTGGSTTITGVTIDDNDPPLELVGYGGGCGGDPITEPVPLAGKRNYGGCGAGNGGSPPGVREPGPAGVQGGRAGLCGVLKFFTITGEGLFTKNVTREVKYTMFQQPWMSGANGASFGDPNRGFTMCNDTVPCPATTVPGGGRPGRGIFGGAGGMFGAGGDTFPDDIDFGQDAAPNSCAGGGARTDIAADSVSFGKGGSGRVVIRYWNV